MGVSPSSFGEELVLLFRSGRLAATVLTYSLWSITPLSWLYVGWTIYKPTTTRFGLFGQLAHVGVLSYAALELPFSIWYRYLAYKVQRRVPLPKQDEKFLRHVLIRSLESGMSDTLRPIGREEDLDNEEPSFVREKLAHDDPRAVDFRGQMSVWFLMTKFDDVRRDDVREWLSWSLLDSHLHEVEAEADPDRLALLEWAFGLIQARSAQTIPPGRGVNVRPLRLTLDYVRIDQRPLLLYLVINGINAWTVWNAKRVGFQAQRFEGIEYLIRPARRKASPLKPLLFWHGLGIGLGQYTACFDYLARDPRLDGRTIIVLRQPHISYDIMHPNFLSPPVRSRFIPTLRKMLRKLHLDENGIDLLAHSNGTTLAAWLIKSAPDLVKRCCLVDPVCFCLYEPDVPHAFLYSKPTRGIEILMRYFVARELGTASTLQRHFDWTSNLLWAEDINYLDDPNRMNVYLAENDRILSAHRVAKYLIGHGMKHRADGGGLTVATGAQHGECLTESGPGLRSIVAWFADPETAEEVAPLDTKSKDV